MAETKFNASSTSFDSRVDLATHILANMKSQSARNGTTGILLAGDPGVGKTSFMRFFSKLTGLALITIEAPHIMEEHIINIPYIVMRGSSVHKAVTSGEAEAEGEDADYKIVMADSNLYTAVTREKKLSDVDYLKDVYSSDDQTLIKIFEDFGGDKKTIPDLIAKIRSKYETILFLDEFFRQTSPRIRNMLRTILNGKIGHHDLPKYVYVAYASNINDSGIEEISKNMEFFIPTMKSPPKDEWFAWLVNKYEKDEHHKLKDDVVQEFYKLLKEEDISMHDVEADVRTSPRRWEQLLTYINSSLPVKDTEDAKSLLTNVKLNFRHYKTGAHSKLVDAVLDTTLKLIESTSKIKMPATVHGASSWRKTLRHQIEQKMKMGEARSYLPIIAGLPGIGKTSEIYELGRELNLAVIDIDVSMLFRDEVTGIPVPKTTGDKIETKFSLPKLYQHIKTEARNAEQDHIEALKAGGSKDAVAEYKKKEWRYLLFFDELNRNNPNVFNGIRRLILEKNLGKGLELPKGTIIVAALNPEDAGAETLTQHMVDVADVIDAAPSWSDTKRILKQKKFEIDHPEVEEFVYGMLLAFVDNFHHKKGDAPKGADREYFINIGGSQPVYITPREYTNLYVNGVEYLDIVISRILRKREAGGKPTAEQLHKDVITLKDALYSKFEHILNTVMLKYENAPEFLHSLKRWFREETSVDVESMFFSKKASTIPLADILSKYMVSGGKHLADDIDFISYVKNSDPQSLKDDIQMFIEKEITDIAHIVGETHQKKVLDSKNSKIDVIAKPLISKYEHVIRELVNSFRLHDFSNEKKEIVEGVILEFNKKMSKIIKMDAEDMIKFVGVSGKIKQFTKGTKD